MSTSTSVPLAHYQSRFQADIQPFNNSVETKATFPAMEQAAGDTARLLDSDTWSASTRNDIASLRSAATVMADAAGDYNAFNAGLEQWETAYNRVAADLQLPQLGGS